jgi:hypothetical protein
MRRLFGSVRYANITATLALLVALGGTSYAAVQVTGADVRDGSITGKDIKKESLGSKQIKGLTAADFAAPLPAGPAGPAGPPGAPGAPGAAGSAKAYAHVTASRTLDADRSSGLTLVASVLRVKCLDYTAGTPLVAVATPDFGGADGYKAIVSVTTDPTAVAAYCPAPADLAVSVSDAATYTTMDWAFYVAVIA